MYICLTVAGPVSEATGNPAGKESGVCSVAVLLREGRLSMAHVGDARAVLGTLDDDGGTDRERALIANSHGLPRLISA